jgi:hypothetical protein
MASQPISGASAIGPVPGAAALVGLQSSSAALIGRSVSVVSRSVSLGCIQSRLHPETSQERDPVPACDARQITLKPCQKLFFPEN